MLGIAVATVLVVSTLFYREAMVTVSPPPAKKSKVTAQAAVVLNKSIQVMAKILDVK